MRSDQSGEGDRGAGERTAPTSKVVLFAGEARGAVRERNGQQQQDVGVGGAAEPVVQHAKKDLLTVRREG